MDYRALLKKYIDHVGETEGTYFLADYYRGGFTDDEWAELKAIVAELEK